MRTTYKTKEEWLAARQKGIGGSEAAAILGMNPYMNNIELWEQKTGKRTKAEIQNTAALSYGTDAEKPLIQLFQLDYSNYKVYAPDHFTLQQNPLHPFILGTVDAELAVNDGVKGFLEIKTSMIFSTLKKSLWNEKIPDNYYIQVLHYFLINPEYQYCFVKAHLRSVVDKDVKIVTNHYYFTRQDREKDIQFLKEKEIDFWNNYVVKNILPPLELPNI